MWGCSRCKNKTKAPSDIQPNKIIASCKSQLNGQRPAASTRKLTCRAGHELTKLLTKLGIKDNGSCGCKSKAAEMDRRGCDWCEANLETIVGWLRESAERQGLPFVEWGARLLVRRAIKTARRRQAEQ